MGAATLDQIWAEAPTEGAAGAKRLRLPPAKLWLRLWAAYAALCFAGISALMIASGTLIDAQNYFASYTERTIADRFEAHAPLLRAAIALPEAERSHSVEAAAATIAANLLDLQVTTDLNGRFLLTAVSDPRVRVEVYGLSGEMLTQAAYTAGGEGAANPRRIRAVFPIAATDGRALGEARVDYAARYDFWKNVTGKAAWAVAMWPITAITSIVIGLTCGVVSARYVTSRLRRVDAVAARWRMGDFSKRISLASGDELEAHAERLNEMARELQTHLDLKQAVAVADERNRIARDLHDTVKQKLFALGLQIAAIDAKARSISKADGPRDDVFGDNIAEAEAITREAQRDLVEIITQLRPTGENNADLPARIAPIADDYMRRFDVAISVSGGDGLKAGPRAEVNLIRIIQEAIANAIRHGGARNIRIAFDRTGPRRRLTVADDGAGFDPQTIKKGLGIQSIEHRAGELPAGRAAYASRAGAGATLNVSWREGLADD